MLEQVSKISVRRESRKYFNLNRSESGQIRAEVVSTKQSNLTSINESENDEDDEKQLKSSLLFLIDPVSSVKNSTTTLIDRFEKTLVKKLELDESDPFMTAFKCVAYFIIVFLVFVSLYLFFLV